MKKGIFFTMDAILAAGIIILTILLASKYYIQEDQSSTGYFLSSDAVRIFSDIRVSELESAYAAQLIQSGDIEDANSTVLEQIGRFWSDGKEDLAENFSRNMTDGIIPKEFGVGIYVDGEEIYSRGTPVKRSLVSSRKIISGVTKAKPKDGYTTKVILNGIDSKTTSTYSYFGGFEGNGNITKKLILPNNVNSIINISLELDAGSDFSLYANGAFSGTYVKGSAGGGEMKADKFFIDRAYFGNFANGTNVFSINFTGEDKYVAGGFLRVKYSTSDMNDTFNPRGAVYWLPGINGIINVFSSVYSPSDITNIEAYLEFYSNYTTFLKLGKTLVYNNKTNGSTSAYISNQTFSSAIAAEGLSYSGISRKTLPLRVGLNFTKVITGGNADVILITDVSGSMNWRLDNSNTGTTRTCEDPNLYSPSTKRISLAKCLDKQFIDILLNSSLGNTTNRVGLVAYSGLPSSFGSSNVDTIVSTHDLSYDNVSLKNQIDGYNPNGATGVCGAIRQARTILEQQGNSTRRKFIVVMTDGLANVQCDETSQYESTGCIAQQCPNSNFCFSGGQPGCLYQQCGDWVNNASSQNAVNDACRAFNTTNATVFSVGFGPVGSCPIGNDTLVSIADCGRGESFSSTNATQLSTIYSKIAQSILEASFSAQSIEIPGDVNTILSPNSYIMVNFSSLSTLTFAKIPLTFETDRFGNNITTGSFTIPAGTGTIDAKITSYSGDKWTDQLTANGNDVYMLSDFGSDYTYLGDPYYVYVPIEEVQEGQNDIIISTGTSPTNSSGGSIDNRAIYTIMIDTFSDFSQVVSKSDGCEWAIESESGAEKIINVPAGYTGADDCNYFTGTYDADDSADLAFLNLLQKMDIDNDGLLDIDIDENNIDVDTVTISKVPSLWGPAIVEVRIWQ